MKFVCLVHFAPEAFDSLNPAEMASLQARSIAYDRELAARGHLVAAEALQAPDTAVLVKVRDGKISTTDGPFTETKEQLGGFILIEAADLTDAVRIAGGIPMARLGTIELRAIYDMMTPEGGQGE